MRLVLDASAAVNALIPSELRDHTRQRMKEADLCAPHLIDTEVLSALARLVRSGAINSTEADRAVAAWHRLAMTRISVEQLLREIWSLRERIRISDAHYVALAQALEAPLLTADRCLARAALPSPSIFTIG